MENTWLVAIKCPVVGHLGQFIRIDEAPWFE